MTQEIQKKLIKQRSSYKGQLTAFSNFLQSLDDKSDQLSLDELQLRLGKTTILYDNYDKVQFELECLDEDLQLHLPDRVEFESLYYSLVAKAKNILSKRDNPSDALDFKSVSQGHKMIKLPPIPVPSFSGLYDSWLEFHDTFLCLIHNNEDMEDIVKFHHLKSALKGSAALVIQSIEVSSSNYSTAWTLLCERFDNKHLLIQNHVAALFNIECVRRESSDSLKQIIDQVNKNLRSLETLGEPCGHWDTLLIYILTHKLDPKNYREWEESKSRLDKNEKITLKSFLTFLRGRADLLETIELSKTNSLIASKTNNQQKTLYTFSENDASQNTNSNKTDDHKPSCPLCKSEHYLYGCSQFLSLSNNERLSLLQEYKVCYNCLIDGHYANRCKRQGCKICRRKHNTLIHLNNKSSRYQENELLSAPENNQPPKSSDTVNNNVTLSVSFHKSVPDNFQREILLSTALIKVYDRDGKAHLARAVLDSGSTSCIMTENLCIKLNLNLQPTIKAISGINNSISNISNYTRVMIKSLNDEYHSTLTCFILSNITDDIPTRNLELFKLNIPSDISLADPMFYASSPVDILIGADVFWDLLGSQKIYLNSGNPILFETKLGWVVSGQINSSKVIGLPAHPRCNFLKSNYTDCIDDNMLSNQAIQDQLNLFWQLEEVTKDQRNIMYSMEEKQCEAHFIENTSRLDDGKFCVRIPLKQSESLLGNSLQRAKHCLLSLEKRSNLNASFRQRYIDFMSEYKSLGHMSECSLNCHNGYFIPHHGIVRESSLTTKLRVVFNASSPSSSGLSLNNIQMVGPTIQDDLMSILLRFRQHRYCLVSDVQMMYRCISVNPDDRHLQKIVWRDDVTKPLQSYTLNTVTYGTASAPFLAVRCIKQIALECKDDLISEIISHDFYVDDLITGGDDISTVIKIRERVTEELASACMPLKKWRSNDSRLLSDEESTLINLDMGTHKQSKTLGLHWQMANDNLVYEIETNNDTINLTKRGMLSKISSIFDPLGLLSPCIVVVKILLQQLWLERLGWDDPLPSDVSKKWMCILQTFPELNSLTIPRRVICDSYNSVELHIFCDASQDAYGACIYARSYNANNEVLVRLLCAKSRVTPIKPVTIPRLELCAALVGARLYEKVKSSLRLHISGSVFWSDSTIVLGWLRMLPSKLQPFVRNRVADILEITGSCLWRHVSTKENPADLISRGIEVKNFQNCDIWWSGPNFLHSYSLALPESPLIDSDHLPELKNQPNITLTVCETDHAQFIEFSRFSGLTRLKRVTAYVLRFVKNCKRVPITTKYLSTEELQESFYLLMRLSQKESFPDYQTLLKNKSVINAKSPLTKFNIFFDEHKLIRVGGRLMNSNYDYNKKYPFILQSTHTFTKLLFEFEHIRLFHAGPQLMLSSLRETYWPIGGRNLAKSTFHKCIICNRFKGKTYAPVMGNLPKERITSDVYPFEHVGVDYAGPILSASKRGRGCTLVKVYIAIFICLSTKAVHIELVGSLLSECFMSCLRRFISRRENIFSDNGTSFVGASNEIGRFLKNDHASLSEKFENDGIKFHFIPAYSPHFGGIWEAGVKTCKYHLVRVLGNAHLVYEELYTVLVQIEAIMNSRPLTPLSSEPEDMLPLTPGHFLIGRPLTSFPMPSFTDSNYNYLTRFQRIEKLRQDFWKRWNKEYVSELQQRVKWQKDNYTLKVNALVLIKEENLPPLKWKLGRVISTYPGKDGISRVADIKTSSGVVRRAFNRLCPLPECQ